MQKTVLIKENNLLRQKFVWCGPGVELLTSCFGGVLVVLACHLLSKKHFADDVVSR
jgi:hypothetical protein